MARTSTTIAIRITWGEKDRWDAAAASVGLCLSEWIRERCREPGDPVDASDCAVRPKKYKPRKKKEAAAPEVLGWRREETEPEVASEP